MDRLAAIWKRNEVFYCLACTPVLLLFAVLCQGIPPNYDDVRTFERRLPQHSVAPVDGRARLVRFTGHLWGHGLNNILQEALLMSYLAYVSNVSFVFEDYTWSHIPLPWTLYGLALRPTSIPINAIISGPTAGGPMPSAPNAPLAVSADFFQSACPSPRVLSPTNIPTDADGTKLIDYWSAQLDDVDADCIAIDTRDIFDRFLFGGPRILSVFDDLVRAPVLRDFAWSPLVQSALARNFVVLHRDGVLALHLRRGDYVRHCPNLATWGADYMGINQHPSLPDRFDPRPFHNDSSARLAYYLSHCLPTTDEIVARLREVRASRPGLKTVYVLTNEGPWALGGLKDALTKDGWADVNTSVDLVLDAQQFYVGMAVDMAIAERADVFVGNGFSSLSSNVVLLRLAKGMDPSSNRFL